MNGPKGDERANQRLADQLCIVATEYNETRDHERKKLLESEVKKYYESIVERARKVAATGRYSLAVDLPGARDDDPTRCVSCNGRGTQTNIEHPNVGLTETCPFCRGSGRRRVVRW